MSTTLTRADGRVTRRRRGAGAGRAVVALTSLLVVGYAAVIVGSGFRALPAEVAANHTPWFVWVHVVFAAVALATMPLQLFPALRRRARVHRWIGRTYAVSAVVGGTFGTLAALTTDNGAIAGAGFLTLGVLWVWTTVAAVTAARGRRLEEHRRWALCSAALAFAGVTLRLELGLGIPLTGSGFAHAYPVVAWLCWVPNLALAWWWGRRPSDDPALTRR